MVMVLRPLLRLPRGVAVSARAMQRGGAALGGGALPAGLPAGGAAPAAPSSSSPARLSSFSSASSSSSPSSSAPPPSATSGGAHSPPPPTPAGLEVYASAAEHLAALDARGALPRGFRVGTHAFTFRPAELPDKVAPMRATVIALDAPTPDWAALFTSNALPGAPVLVGRARLAGGGPLQAIVVNNKVSNVAAPGGVAAAEAVAAAAAAALALPGGAATVLPCSTGVIGWRLPVAELCAALPAAAAGLGRGSALPAAAGICTTDAFPKLRAVTLSTGARVVGIAKGAGMVEPNLATMLAFVMTDAAVPRARLRAALAAAADASFNCMSVDGDQSTSDTLVALASGAVPTPPAALPEFDAALAAVCGDLARDVARNGEGVQHVLRVRVRGAGGGAGGRARARAVGKAVVNSPLFKCAVAGNDPNVGRLVAAVGDAVGAGPPRAAPGAPPPDLARASISVGGRVVFRDGAFDLPPDAEPALVAHLRSAQLWQSAPRARPRPGAAGEGGAVDVDWPTPVAFPPHGRFVEVGVDLGLGGSDADGADVVGADLTHEYVAENADYRS